MCSNCDHLDDGDSLATMFGSTVATAPAPARTAPEWYKPITERFTESCSRCGGTGTYGRFGQCFKCKGSGKLSFATSRDERARNRATTHARKARVEADKQAATAQEAATFVASHEAEIAWLRAASRRNTEAGRDWLFPQDMLNAVNRYGSLTDNQLAAVRKLMARDSERKADAVARAANAPAVTVERIEKAFADARAAGLKKHLKLRLDTFVFSPAGASSSNAGAIYVKEAGEYLGKIAAGKFHAVRACGDERAARILAAAADPEAAAVAFGKRTGTCSCCGAELTNADSIERGIGPICADKWGW